MLAIKRSKLRAGPRRQRAYARIRRIVWTVVILVIVCVIIGIAYTWYMGRTPVKIVEAPVVTKKTVQTPSVPDANTKIGAAIQAFTATVAPGSNASLSVHTVAGAACSIQVVYKDQVGTDSGLIPKVADEFGMVTWTWTVESSRPVGTWPVNVTCAYNNRSAYVRGDLVVAAPSQ